METEKDFANKYLFWILLLLSASITMNIVQCESDKPDPATASKIQQNNDSIAKRKAEAEMAKKTADDLLQSYGDNRTAAAKKATKHIENAKAVRKVVFDTVGNGKYLTEYESVNKVVYRKSIEL